MSTSRSNCSVIVLDEWLVVVGGYNKKPLKTVEKYNPSTKKWVTLPSLKIARANHCLVHTHSFVKT